MTKWINAGRKDPKEEGYYLTVCKNRLNNYIWIAISYYEPPQWWDTAGTSWREINVTHWMPLPELPEEEK